MGATFVTARASWGGRRKIVRFHVDSGATYTVLPEKIWQFLRLRPQNTISLSLADGTMIQRRLSECRIGLRGVERTSPVILGQKSDAALLGVVTLEILGLVLNPLTRDLNVYPAVLGGAPARP